MNSALALLIGMQISLTVSERLRSDAVWDILTSVRPNMLLSDVRQVIRGRTGPLVCPLAPDTRINGEGEVTAHCGAARVDGEGGPPILFTFGVRVAGRDTSVVAVAATAQLALTTKVQPADYFEMVAKQLSAIAGERTCTRSTSCFWRTEHWEIVAVLGGLGPQVDIRLTPLRTNAPTSR